MARPNKQGIDYFPLDVHLDDKFKFIEIKYKLEGFAILIKLFQKIYSCGYWYKWTEDEALLFADEIKTDFELVWNVVNECLLRDVFNKELHVQYGILTSKGIQKRYKEIVRRRKGVEVIEEYLLIDNDFGVNDVINPSTCKRDDGKSTQSKVKETKEKETKERSPKQVYDETSLYFQLAIFFYERILENNPEHKKPNLQKWAEEIRKLIEIDNRSEEQVRYLMRWAQEDDFEKANVLSPVKLRKRFDDLIMKVKQQRNKNSKQSIFAQGPESRKRQDSIQPLTSEETEQMKRWEEELPY